MEEGLLPAVLEFDWDEGNITKSWIRHRVPAKDQEQAFINYEKVIVEDKIHSERERRFLLYGKTNKGQLLIIVFTIRNKKIRCISARPMNRKEAKLYEETIKMA